MEAKNTVSVVMCTYNGEEFLREQMDSILAQTYPIMEIIVQDDCSTDNTVDIIKRYAVKDENKAISKRTQFRLQSQLQDCCNACPRRLHSSIRPR